MKPSRLSLIASVFCVIVAAACGPTQLQIQATATSSAATEFAAQTAAVTATASPTRTPRPTATATPTPAPLTASEIFEQISPSIVFVETPAGTGSGVLLEGGYIVTNAHVVWPYAEVRIVFADGVEHTGVPVHNSDLMADLAIVGPVDTRVEPEPFLDGERQVVGSDVFLIGYPGEVDRFPSPTIASGVISRVREAASVGITYFQTDAQVAGGQSGGVLVSEMGEVIGLSGFAFTEASYGLVASAADLLPRIEALIAGEDMAQLGDRRIIVEGGQTEYDFELADYWDSRIYVVQAATGSDVEVSVESQNDAVLEVIDVYGNRVLSLDDSATGFEGGRLMTQTDAPYFVHISQLAESSAHFHVRSNRQLLPYEDTDDGHRLKAEEALWASIDHPGDVDYFLIDLEAGETVHLRVESIMVDPYVLVDYPGADAAQFLYDDDSAGGVFGLDAELTYQAPHADRYRVVVGDSAGVAVGGYRLTVGRPGADAPTPSVPVPTATPIVGPAGPMALYTSQRYPFAIQYPADWEDLGAQPELGVTANYGSDDGAFSVVEQDMGALGYDGLTLPEYTDMMVDSFRMTMRDFSLISSRRVSTPEGAEVAIVEYTAMAGAYRGAMLLHVHEGGVGFSATYVFASQDFQSKRPLIDYSFGTFQSGGQ